MHHDIPLDRLVAHPANSNVMPPKLLDKLAAHIEQTDRYPPVIVRPLPTSEIRDQKSEITTHQILDGHHRVEALRRLKHDTAHCVIWDVDDDEAMMLLATLNRLQGHDDPRKRASLVAQLSEKLGVGELSAKLPEQAKQIKHLLELHRPDPPPRAPQRLDDMPVAVHFFLLPAQHRRLEQTLTDIDPSRERALMTLVDAHHKGEPCPGG